MEKIAINQNLQKNDFKQKLKIYKKYCKFSDWKSTKVGNIFRILLKKFLTISGSVVGSLCNFKSSFNFYFGAFLGIRDLHALS